MSDKHGYLPCIVVMYPLLYMFRNPSVIIVLNFNLAHITCEPRMICDQWVSYADPSYIFPNVA